jgi:hypothetical protein
MLRALTLLSSGQSKSSSRRVRSLAWGMPGGAVALAVIYFYFDCRIRINGFEFSLSRTKFARYVVSFLILDFFVVGAAYYAG